MKYLLSVNIIFTDTTETEKKSANWSQETFSPLFQRMFFAFIFLVRKRGFFLIFTFQKEFSYENEPCSVLVW